MKYRVTGKSAKEITGKDCKSFTLKVMLNNGEAGYFDYLESMNEFAGMTFIVETDTVTDYDFTGHKYRWLKDWVKDIRPLNLREEFKFELLEKEQYPAGLNWWVKYANWLEEKLEKE